MFSDHNEMKLDINNRKEIGKLTNMWKLNKALQNNQWNKEQIKKEIRKCIGIHENEDS